MVLQRRGDLMGNVVFGFGVAQLLPEDIVEDDEKKVSREVPSQGACLAWSELGTGATVPVRLVRFLSPFPHRRASDGHSQINVARYVDVDEAV
jgi:hypothetical protein